MTDDETEMLACKAVYEAIEALEKLENEYECPRCGTTRHRIRHINIEWVVEKKESEEWESMKGLQSVYNQIINILKENNVLINITPPRPYLIKKDDEERINAEVEDLFKKCKIEEYNSKMKEKEAYKLYFDEAYKYTNFYEEGDE